MKQTWAIAKSVFRLLFRAGTGWGILAATSLVACLIFFCSSADDVLLAEMQLRIRYSSYLSAGLLSFALLFVSCVSMRGDIEGKQMHMLTSYPIKRLDIWLGKWLGLQLFAILGLAVIAASVASSAAVFHHVRTKRAPSDVLPPDFWRCLYAVEPVRESLRELVERGYLDRQRKAQLPPDLTDAEARRALAREIRRDLQLVAPGKSRLWQFHLGHRPRRSDQIVLRFKFYLQNDRQMLVGKWFIGSEETTVRAEELVQAPPYRVNALHVPVGVVPESGGLKAVFQPEEGAPTAIFPREDGVLVLYDDGLLIANLARTLFIYWLYLGVVVAVGLTVSTAFTFAVAAFASVVLLALALASSFFRTVTSDLMWEEPTRLKILSTQIIRFGIWLSQGLRPPQVLAQFSDGLSVRIADALIEWGASALPYALFFAIIGMVLLTRKELDRVY